MNDSVVVNLLNRMNMGHVTKPQYNSTPEGPECLKESKLLPELVFRYSEEYGNAR
jgi:hypothetical protein